MITLRPANLQADATAIAALFQLNDPTVSAATVRGWEPLPEGALALRLVAEQGGAVVGYGAAQRFPWSAPGNVGVWVVVDPHYRNLGIGAALDAQVTAFALAHGARRLHSEAREADAAATRFWQRRGYTVRRRIFESTLDLAAFDPAPHTRPVTPDVRFLTLAETAQDEAALRRLHALFTACVADIPGYEGGPQPYEQFLRNSVQQPWFRADGQIIAAVGPQWVGFASVGLEADQTEAINHMTGVLAAFRGRRIALALKLRAIETAKSWGAATILTNNDEENAPMLAINRRLGYVPQPGILYLVRAADAAVMEEA